MAGFYIRHLTTAGVEIGEFAPLNLQYNKSLDPPNTIMYEIPQSYQLGTASYCRPYRNDFVLYNDSGDDVMGGFITEVAVEDNEYGRTTKVAGKDWLHYLERNIWPKNPNSNYRTTTLADPTNGTVFDYTGSVDYVVYNLIREAINDSGITDTFTYFFTGVPASGGTAAHLRIDPGDTTPIMEHIMNVFAMGDDTATPLLKCAATKHIDISASGGTLFPRFGSTSAAQFKFHAMRRGGNCRVTGMRHGGIRGTRAIGIAQGPSSKKWAEASYSGSVYRRWDLVEEFSSPNAFGNLQTLTDSMRSDAANPDLEITLELANTPEHTVPWFEDVVFPGSRCSLVAELGWIDISDNFTVTSVNVSVPNDGNSTYTITLNQPLSTT